MLFDAATLEGIASGRITAAYRWWRRPAAVVGGRQVTSIGVLHIDGVDLVEPDALTAADAAAAGVSTPADLLRSPHRDADRRLYRVTFHLAGPDPRVALRDEPLDEAGRRGLVERLGRMDARSEGGPWTAKVLDAIAERPGTVSTDLAADLGMERDVFKRRVRQLKELGLTESLEVGYRLSPRGRSLLADRS